MKKPDLLSIAAITLFTLVVLSFSAPTRAGVVLPDTGGFIVGDFTVYSLAEINVRAGFGSPNPGDPFYVKSTPGELLNTNAIVLATGTNNAGVVDNPPLMDDAYPTPSGGAMSSLTFNTELLADPGGTGEFTGDVSLTWDAEVGALRDYLNAGGGEFVVYFNLNETGTNGLPGIDLLIWAEFTLYKAGGTDPITFTLFDNFEDSQMAFNDWVYAFGEICASTTTFFHGGPCDGSEPAGAQTISQNLGENIAAFAAFNQELNDLILDPTSGYVSLSISARMSEMNDGYEQVFILSDTTTTPRIVSEPGMLGLLIGGLMLILLRRRISRTRINQ